MSTSPVSAPPAAPSMLPSSPDNTATASSSPTTPSSTPAPSQPMETDTHTVGIRHKDGREFVIMTDKSRPDTRTVVDNGASNPSNDQQELDDIKKNENDEIGTAQAMGAKNRGPNDVGSDPSAVTLPPGTKAMGWSNDKRYFGTVREVDDGKGNKSETHSVFDTQTRTRHIVSGIGTGGNDFKELNYELNSKVGVEKAMQTVKNNNQV